MEYKWLKYYSLKKMTKVFFSKRNGQIKSLKLAYYVYQKKIFITCKKISLKGKGSNEINIMYEINDKNLL